MKYLKTLNELHSDTYFSAAEKIKNLEGDSELYKNMIASGEFAKRRERPSISNKKIIQLYKNNKILKDNFNNWRELKNITPTEIYETSSTLEDFIEIFEILNVDINLKDIDGWNVLNKVIYDKYSTYRNNHNNYDYYGLIEYLIGCGVRVNELDGDGDETNLSIASHNGDIRVVEILLDNGADPNKRGDGECPLFYSIIEGHLEVVKILINTGASDKIPNFGEESALDAARLNNRTDIYQYLKKINY